MTADWLAIFHDIAVLHPSHPVYLQQPSAEILHWSFTRSWVKALPAGCTHCRMTTGRRAQTCSLRRVPSPASSPVVSFIPLQQEGISTAYPLVLLHELLEETLSEPKLTCSMCLKLLASCKVAGPFPATVI